jgi:hypothetical protein
VRDGSISQNKYATIDVHVRVCKLVLQKISDFCPHSCVLIKNLSEMFKFVLAVYLHYISETAILFQCFTMVKCIIFSKSCRVICRMELNLILLSCLGD